MDERNAMPTQINGLPAGRATDQIVPPVVFRDGKRTVVERVLADGEYYRVGGHAPQKSNVRVIAATHQELETRVAQRTRHLAQGLDQVAGRAGRVAGDEPVPEGMERGRADARHRWRSRDGQGRTKG